jgi:hypothetical protein
MEEDEIVQAPVHDVGRKASSLQEAAQSVKMQLAEALHKPANATISITKDGDHWTAQVEVVEEEYLPGQQLKSMNDILGLYEVEMDMDGQLLNWTKRKTYKRSQGL